MDEDFEKNSEKGIVFYLSPGSKISEVLKENKFHEVVLALVGEKNMRDVEQLKVRAVLDSENDITEEYVECSPEQKIKRTVDLAKNYLQSGNLLEAKELARSVFHKLTDKDIDIFDELIAVFKECADNFYALKGFCKVRLLEKSYWDPLFSLLNSRNYWLHVINGPYELREIMRLFREIEDMILEYKEIDEYSGIVNGILFELLLSYRQLTIEFCSQADKASIDQKILRVQFYLCTLFYRQGLYNQVCDIYKHLDRDRVELDIDNLYMWAKALKDLGKIEVALKKIEEASQKWNSGRKEMLVRMNCSPEEIKDLHESLIFQMNQIPKEQTDVDVDWLSGTNISLPQHMRERAMQVKGEHVKKARSHRRPKKHRYDQPETPVWVESAQTVDQNKDLSGYRSWKDVPPSDQDFPEKSKSSRRKMKEREIEMKDFNVEIVEEEKSESDSGQESSNDTDGYQKKPFSYQAPEYQHLETDSETYSDSGFDTFDDESQFDPEDVDSRSTVKAPSSSELVVSGITITEKCKDSLLKKKSFEFNYPDFLSEDELRRCLQNDKNKYKKCTVEIESAHKAVCRNLNLEDEIQEILISGRSKCGRVFMDDEVVVEILGESKAQKNYIPRLKINLANETKDNNIYGKIIGRLKRKRFSDLEHPVLICAKDELFDHSMKPLCKTVPKINVFHKNCVSRYQVDLFSYDARRKVVEHLETVGIDRAHKNAYCFLVAIINWENIYPFGIVLKVINTRGDVKSGLGILRLQYRVPLTYSKEATEATNAILQQKHDIGNKKVIKGFTIIDGKQGPIEAAYSVALIESGSYRVGIHIIDPTSIIKKGDAIDKEAEKRGTDFYVNKDVQPVYMIPEVLSKRLFSIETGIGRKTLTVFFNVSFDRSNEILSENFEIAGRVEESVIVSEKQYNIAEVQTLLKTKHTKSDIRILHLASMHLRKLRLKNASFFTDINEMFPYEKNNFIECIDAHLLIGELHIFANQTIAKFLFDRYPNCVPCKCHPRPSEKAMLGWKNSHNENLDNILFQLQNDELGPGAVCSIFNCNPEKIRYSHLIPIQHSVWKLMQDSAKSKQFDKFQHVLGADEVHPMQALGLDEWIRIQETSEFKCSTTKSEKSHFDLRVSIYTYFTAPLSRFMDLAVHRIVHAALDNETKPPYTEEEIKEICDRMNKANCIRKQFRKSCLVFLFAHSLHSTPRMFNGFIQNVTNNDVELVFPTLRKLPRLSKILPLNLLKTKQNPEFEKEIGFDRFFMTLKWKHRIYSLKRITKNPPNENYLRIDPNQNVQFHLLSKWVKIIQAFFEGKTKNIYSLMLTDESSSKQQIRASWDTVNDVSSEVRGGTFAQQTSNYSLSFIYGQVIVIQMCADADRGMLTPMPQLLDITPNVKICLQHTRDPLSTFTSLATKSAKDKYASPKQYVDTWMPILSMEVATQTADGDSITINDLPITFRSEGGAFSLKQSFLEKRDIEFTSHSVDLLGNEDDDEKETQEQNERFYMSGSDFLCIRCPLEPLNDIVSNFGKGAISPLKRYWIGHAKVDDVRYKTKKGERNVSVSFLRHNKSPQIPPEMLNKKRECSVEILPKSDVYRRTELYVKWLDGASDLAKAIALRKRPPELDKIHREMGDEIRSPSDTLGVGLAYNDNQRKAIKKALTSSFSLIQGPPGTGKTLTGVALIKLFCIINQKYFELSEARHFVVFCGPSNKSVDLVTVHLKESFGDLKILRMYGSALEGKEFPIPGKVYPIRRADAAPDESLRDVSLHHIIRKPGNQYAEKIKDFDRKFKTDKNINFREVKEYKKILSKAVKEEVSKYDVILCTTSVATSSRLLNGTSNLIYQLLIDEAGMCTEPECLATIVATRAKQVVLIGDHKQLQPVVLCQEAGNLGLQKSLFERYAESDLSEKVLTLLTNQYRMHPSLCRFPSYAFYDKKLVTKKSSKWEVLEPLSIWRDYRNPLVFCHTEGEEEYLVNSSEEGNEMSKFNRAEIDQVEKVFQCLVKREGVSPENINVMSQYNAQCSKIKEKLKKYHVQNVNTVVASQGGEWDYVIFSLVRSLPGYRIEPFPTDGWRTENLGFINDDHQINVALTRARKGLVIIGNKELMKRNEVFKTLLEDYGRHGCIEDTDQFPPVYKRKK